MARKEYQFKMPDGSISKAKLDLPKEQEMYEAALQLQRMTPEEYEEFKALMAKTLKNMGIE